MTRLKEVVPCFVSTHCAAHRLALAALHACRASPVTVRFHNAYTFFSKSTVRAHGLQEMEQVLNEPQLRLKHAMETRWLSHESVLDALQRCLLVSVFLAAYLAAFNWLL